jgi:hypothetical protein
LSGERKAEDSTGLLIQKKKSYGAFWFLGEGKQMSIFEGFSRPAIRPKKNYVSTVRVAGSKILEFIREFHNVF